MTGERKLKNNETNRTEMRDGVYMYVQQWPGMVISASAKKSGLSGRKEGRESTVGQCFACVDTTTIATFVAFTVPSTTPMSNTRHKEMVWLVYIRL